MTSQGHSHTAGKKQNGIVNTSPSLKIAIAKCTLE